MVYPVATTPSSARSGSLLATSSARVPRRSSSSATHSTGRPSVAKRVRASGGSAAICAAVRQEVSGGALADARVWRELAAPRGAAAWRGAPTEAAGPEPPRSDADPGRGWLAPATPGEAACASPVEGAGACGRRLRAARRSAASGPRRARISSCSCRICTTHRCYGYSALQECAYQRRAGLHHLGPVLSCSPRRVDASTTPPYFRSAHLNGGQALDEFDVLLANGAQLRRLTLRGRHSIALPLRFLASSPAHARVCAVRGRLRRNSGFLLCSACCALRSGTARCSARPPSERKLASPPMRRNRKCRPRV